MKRKRLTQEIKNQILEFRQQGLTIEKIASLLNIGMNEVSYINRKHGINKRVDGISPEDEVKITNYLNEGLSVPKISELLGFTLSSINRFLKRNNYIKIGRSYSTGLSKDQESKIIEMVKLGYGRDKISNLLDVGESCVRKFCKNLDVKNINNIYASKITPEIEKQIWSLKFQGMNSVEIGEILDINRNTIAKFAKKRNDPFLRSKLLTEEEKVLVAQSKRLRKNFSKTIHRVLRDRRNDEKYHSISDYLPYTVIDLKNHIESKFESWMTWNNWGKYNKESWMDTDQSTWTWNIDHIIPESTFKYISMHDQDFLKCWALENLRPYSAKLNIMDGANKIRH